MGTLTTSIRNFEALAEAIRSGSACIPITELTGGDASIPDPYFGSLVVEGDEAELRLRSHSNAAAKLHFKDFGKIGRQAPKFKELKCVLDGHFEVSVKSALSSTQSLCSESGAFHRYTFNDIVLTGSGERDNEASQVRIVSKIARSKLLFTNLTVSTRTACSLEGDIGDRWRRDGLGGEIPPYRYKIRQDSDDIVIEVMLLSGAKSLSAESDLKFLGALVLTFFWINGGHPYTYVSTHERSHELVESFIQPLKRNPRCKARLISSCDDGDLAAAVLDCGIRFFQAGGPLAEDLRLLLWQYRDATADDSISLGMLLQGCSLLEGLVGLVLRHSMGQSRSQIDKLKSPGQPLADKREGHAEARFHQAGIHLGFSWDLQLRPVFETWKRARNALAHGDFKEFSLNAQCPVLDSYRQIIQAFNGISLRLIGYKGRVRMDDWWYPVSD